MPVSVVKKKSLEQSPKTFIYVNFISSDARIPGWAGKWHNSCVRNIFFLQRTLKLILILDF